MDIPKLRKLTRTQLQTLAKVCTLAPARAPHVDTNGRVSQREVVRAVGKTEDIIRRLMQKHPRGVPIPEYVSPTSSDTRVHVLTKPDFRDADNPSASSAPPKRNVLKKSPKGTPSPIPETSEDRTDPKGTYTPVFGPYVSSCRSPLGCPR